MALGGASSVARSMVNYIYYFFSCRHCAENFRHKVNSLGFLPATSRDSILWLWQIHNMANKNLKGTVKGGKSYLRDENGHLSLVHLLIGLFLVQRKKFETNEASENVVCLHRQLRFRAKRADRIRAKINHKWPIFIFQNIIILMRDLKTTLSKGIIFIL